MRLADSRALVPDLVTAPVEPPADRRLIETIASWCDRYTPWVAIDPLGDAVAQEDADACSAGGFGGDAGLLLDVTGCGHLFGQGEAGERALLADLTERLSRHDFACRAAMADTAGAAWALARFAEKQADLFCPPRASATRWPRCRSTACGSTSRSSRPSSSSACAASAISIPCRARRSPAASATRRSPASTRRWAGSTSRSSRAARRPPSARASPSPSRSAGPRTSPPRPAACWPPSAGSSSRRASARASWRSRSIASTARSTAPPSAPAGPIATIAKLMKLFEEKLGELDPGFGVELMILSAPEVEEWTGAQDALPEAARAQSAGRGRHDRSRRPAGAAAGQGQRRAPAAARQPHARARADDGADLRRGRARRRLGARSPR